FDIAAVYNKAVGRLALSTDREVSARSSSLRCIRLMFDCFTLTSGTRPRIHSRMWAVFSPDAGLSFATSRTFAAVRLLVICTVAIETIDGIIACIAVTIPTFEDRLVHRLTYTGRGS